jgi:hypothetical protein
MLNFYWLPTVRAASALELKHAAEAIDLLQVTAPYELGQPLQMGPATLYPVYVRGRLTCGCIRAIGRLLSFKSYWIIPVV